MLKALVGELEELVIKNDRELHKVPRNSQQLTIFHDAVPQTMSFRQFATLKYQFMGCSDSGFVIGGMYIDRLTASCSFSPALNSHSCHNILLTSVAIAAKLLDDNHNNNSFFVDIGGLPVSRMNKFELELLYILDFDIWVWDKQYLECVALL